MGFFGGKAAETPIAGGDAGESSPSIDAQS
jgi:hypothetical protein